MCARATAARWTTRAGPRSAPTAVTRRSQGICGRRPRRRRGGSRPPRPNSNLAAGMPCCSFLRRSRRSILGYSVCCRRVCCLEAAGGAWRRGVCACVPRQLHAPVRRGVLWRRPAVLVLWLVLVVRGAWRVARMVHGARMYRVGRWGGAGGWVLGCGGWVEGWAPILARQPGPRPVNPSYVLCAVLISFVADFDTCTPGALLRHYLLAHRYRRVLAIGGALRGPRWMSA
jgi:hypothetical protein